MPDFLPFRVHEEHLWQILVSEPELLQLTKTKTIKKHKFPTLDMKHQSPADKKQVIHTNQSIS